MHWYDSAKQTLRALGTVGSYGQPEGPPPPKCGEPIASSGLPLVREKSGKFKVREKSGNFVIGQGNLEF